MSLTAAQIQILKDNASLILAPSAPYGVGGFQAIRPVTEGGRFDFSRTTTKTVIKDGVLTTVPINTPAIDEDGALVFEPARTNLIPYSADVAQSLNAGTLTVTPNVATAPDGTLTADLITQGGSGFRLKTYSIVSGTSYSWSIYFKNSDFTTGQTFDFLMSDGITSAIILKVRPFDKTISSISGGGSWTNKTATITEVEDGYCRVTLSATAGASSTGWSEISGFPTGKSCYVWGLQFEVGAYASSYIPTSGATVTRTVDSPDLRKQTYSGDFFIFLNFIIPASTVGVFDFYNAAGTRIFYLAVDSTGKATVNLLLGGSVQTAFGLAVAAGGELKVLIRKNSGAGTISLFSGGSKHSSDPATTLADFNRFIRIGSFGYETGIKLNVLAAGSEVLSDSTAEALTT